MTKGKKPLTSLRPPVRTSAPQPQPDPEETPQMNTDTAPTPATKAEMSIADEIAAKIAAKSKGFKPDLAVGAASMYDMSRYPDDYSAGGQLEGRFVNKDEARVDIMKNKGYDVPSAWSSRFKDLQHGGQILMLRSKEVGEAERIARRAMATQISTNSRPEYAPSYGSMKEHVSVAETSQEQITLDPDRVSDQSNQSVIVAD